jgi:DNA-binding transcriptional MerR regulator
MPDKEVEKRDARIIQLRRDYGFSAAKIHVQLQREGFHNVPTTAMGIRHVIRDYSIKAREKIQETVDQRFVEHDETLEDLMSLCKVQLKRGFDVNIVKCMILIMERQSKLLGLDMTKSHVPDMNAFLAKASDEQVREEAVRLGLILPEQMSLV